MSKIKIILFRFHSDFEICVERVSIWKHFNPKVPIYGLFGGDVSEWDQVKKIFSRSPLENIQISTHPDRYWKWLHPEHTLREWFRKYGNQLRFDLLFDEEWDILPAASISKLYSKLPSKRSIALTGVEELNMIRSRWRWISGSEHKADFEKFALYIKQTYNIANIHFASLGPGQIFTHEFLNDFASLTLDMNYVNPIVSEIIYPTVAQILNYKIIDTGLYPGWFHRQEAIKYFNCWYVPIEKPVIMEELKRIDGRRVFHPVKYQFPLSNLLS